MKYFCVDGLGFLSLDCCDFLIKARITNNVFYLVEI
jgi:hypothetical protein